MQDPLTASEGASESEGSSVNRLGIASAPVSESSRDGFIIWRFRNCGGWVAGVFHRRFQMRGLPPLGPRAEARRQPWTVRRGLSTRWDRATGPLHQPATVRQDSPPTARYLRHPSSERGLNTRAILIVEQ